MPEELPAGVLLTLALADFDDFAGIGDFGVHAAPWLTSTLKEPPGATPAAVFGLGLAAEAGVDAVEDREPCRA